MKKTADSDFFLTIMCISYNFGEYISDALESFLMQKTDFKFKVFIYDDASTDESHAILKKYKENYPDFIDLHLSEENNYGNPRRLEMFERFYSENFEGKYVAICEGDDFWIDSNKLQKQVDFMEEHPECSLSVHASKWMDYENDCVFEFHPYEKSRYLTDEEVIMQPGGNPSTASILFRREDLSMDGNLKLFGTGDYQRQLFELSKGSIYYFDDVMSVYRECHPGSWTEKYRNNKEYAMKHRFEMYNFLDFYNSFTGEKYEDLIHEKQNNYMYDPYLLDPEVGFDEYFRILDNLPYVSYENKAQYQKGRERVGRIVRGCYKFNEEEAEKYKQFEKILIYGCGDYSIYIRKLLNENNLRMDGYLISDTQEEHREIDGKKVWRLSECPYDIKKGLVFIGVGPNAGTTIKKILYENQVKNVVAPFDF